MGMKDSKQSLLMKLDNAVKLYSYCLFSLIILRNLDLKFRVIKTCYLNIETEIYTKRLTYKMTNLLCTSLGYIIIIYGLLFRCLLKISYLLSFRILLSHFVHKMLIKLVIAK